MNQIPNSYQGKPLIHAWNYYTKDGATFGVVGRYQDSTGKKDIVPFFKANGSGFLAGIELNPRPLFGLDKLATHPKDKAVFIVEGEKSAAALHSIGVCAITSLGGSQSANKADWMPLNGFKTVYLLPDNDEPGLHFMCDVYAALMALKSPPAVKVLNLPDLPPAGDVVDWLQCHAPDWDGLEPFPAESKTWAVSELREELKKAVDVPDDWGLVGLIGSDSGVMDWEIPVEINEKLKPVIPFDMNLLPNSFKPWIADISYRMQCPPDYVAVSAMVALSAIVGKKGLIMPKSKDDWTVCPNIWGLNIGRPSAMKTPAANEALKPLQRLEVRAKETFEQALLTDQVQDFINKEGRTLAEKHAKELIKKQKFSEAKQILLENPEEATKPTRARFMVNDATIEKLGELLNENPNGLMLYRDEISGFLRTIDREDRSNDRAFYLEAFNGLGCYTFDRIGRGTVDIQSVCLAMLGNIQPGVLRPYLSQASDGRTGDDGMIQRFQLMVWPDLTDWKHIDQWPDKNAKNEAFDVFTRLAAWEGYTEPARFSEAAQKLFDEWFCHLHKELRADDIPPALESHFGKYKSLIPSIALLIQLADDKDHSSIVETEAVQKAIAWSKYLTSQAERVYHSALDPVDANAKTILNKIELGKLLDGFGTGDILRSGWTRLDSITDIKAALSRLVEYGWLKSTSNRPAAIGGRPSTRFQIHPKILQKQTT
ncbi:MAG: DUF3987 domain-containing protein [Methylococcales bacterium]|nr:DUF3987 domain-containing protein [Methylococcaceae bacterium]